jgi:5-formyltetrahydrofolate cyclo-ligase
LAKKYFHMTPLTVVDDGQSSADNDLVRQEKQQVRKKLRKSLKELTVDDIGTQSSLVWKQVFELPIFQAAKTVGLFLSMPNSEINTDLILQYCIQNGKKIYVPEVGPNFELCDMELREVILEKDSIPPDGMFHKVWPKNKWEIPEPPSDMPVVVAKPGDIDVMIVPGLGFDRSRNRLGQGKGYYDRFIAKMTADGNVLPLVAVALTPQLVEGSIPVASYDRQMDMIILPEEIIS